MHQPATETMTLRLELFVEDLDRSLDFYCRVLGFAAGERQGDGYTLVRRGQVRIGLNRHANLAANHPVRAAAGERLGRGVEIVLEADDVMAVQAQVSAAGWPLASPLKARPWGLTDFRVTDPDGYYLRITSRAVAEEDPQRS